MSRSDPTIAVVNNDRELLQILRDLLTEAGYTVAICRITGATYQQLWQTQPALIVQHVGIGPTAAGWPVLTQLSRNPQPAQIPILITTVDHAFTDDQAALVQGRGGEVRHLPAGLAALPERVARLCPLI